MRDNFVIYWSLRSTNENISIISKSDLVCMWISTNNFLASAAVSRNATHEKTNKMKRTMELDKGLDSKINELFWILFLRLFFSTCDLGKERRKQTTSLLAFVARKVHFKLKVKNNLKIDYPRQSMVLTVCCGDEIAVKLPPKLVVVALFCNCWCINCPGEVEFGLMLRVELCAGEFPVPTKRQRKIAISWKEC